MFATTPNPAKCIRSWGRATSSREQQNRCFSGTHLRANRFVPAPTWLSMMKLGPAVRTNNTTNFRAWVWYCTRKMMPRKLLMD
jgi:hypothetical protein